MANLDDIARIHALLRNFTLGPVAHDRSFSFGTTKGDWEVISRAELASIDARLESLFQCSSDKGHSIDSVRATWHLWYGDGIKRLAVNSKDHTQIYVCEIHTCLKDGNELKLDGYAVGIEYGAPPLAMHAGHRHYFRATVTQAWLSSAFPDIHNRMLAGESLGIEGYHLSQYALEAPLATHPVIMPEDIACD